MAQNVTAWRVDGEVRGPADVLFSAWIKADNVSPEARGSYNILFKDDKAEVLSNQVVTRFGGTFDWQQFQNVLKAPEGTVSFQVVAGLQRATGSAWFDDFYARPIESMGKTFGTARLLTGEPFPVNTPQTYLVEYTVGEEPVPAGARFRVSFDRWRDEREWRGVSKLAGEVSREGYRLDFQRERNVRTWPPPTESPWFTATLSGPEEGLQQGDTVRFKVAVLTARLTFGDTVVRLGLSRTGAGAFLPLDDPLVLRVRAGEPKSLRVFARSRPLVGQPFRVAACVVDEFDNPVPGYKGTVRLRCDSPTAKLPAQMRLGDDESGWAAEADCVIAEPGVFRVRAKEERAGFEAISNPIWMRESGALPAIFFGDIHVHCNLSSDALGPPDEAYQYARGISGLDFAALSDHGPSGERWEKAKAATARYNHAGDFATILGYEIGWQQYGHKNVYYRGGDEPTYLGRDEAGDPDLLWKSLGDREAITIPHHTNTTAGIKDMQVQPWIQHDFSLKNERFQRVIELCQLRGSFEQDKIDPALRVTKGGYGSSVQDALRRGHRMGFIGSTDNHQGRPAGGPALAAVFTQELTRDAVWTAMRDRRCYATSGARILLDFNVNQSPMGTELRSPANVPRTIHVQAIGTGPLKQIDLIRNGQVLYTKTQPGDQAEFEFRDPEPLTENVYYYARVIQEDTEMAWSSPVWVDRQ
jgi:hypothetical protein